MKIRLSIPLHWRQMIMADWTPSVLRRPMEEAQFAPGVKRDVLTLSAKAAYALILEERDHEPTALQTWQRGVEEMEFTDRERWRRSCSGVYKATRETKLQRFHFKILHRILPCNVYLTQIRIKDSDWCPYCDESDTITHFLFSCSKVRPFWEAACAWFKQADDLYLDRLTADEFIWGMDGGAHRATLVNTITLQLKYYIYRQKLYFNRDLCLLGCQNCDLGSELKIGLAARSGQHPEHASGNEYW